MDIERREKSPVTQALSVLRGLPSAMDWVVDYSVRQICRSSRTGIHSASEAIARYSPPRQTELTKDRAVVLAPEGQGPRAARVDRRRSPSGGPADGEFRRCGPRLLGARPNTPPTPSRRASQ